MAPPEAADLALHTALLVGTLDARAAEERVEPVFSELNGVPLLASSWFQESFVTVGIPRSVVLVERCAG